MSKTSGATALLLTLAAVSASQATATPQDSSSVITPALVQTKPATDSKSDTAEDDHRADEQEHHDEHEHEDAVERIVVQASRSGRIADEQPIRVELINREEIEEKAAMRPGNISMLVAETGGVRVQTTSPALGSANIRLQGLSGRYTQLLADGLPLYGNQASSIGLLQIPPTDLGRVEIIKGSASSLYGGSALGGVINLVSRKPGDRLKGEMLLNATSRDGQVVTGYAESPLTGNIQGSVTVGAHHQAVTDVDQDGWIDLAGAERYTLRPRLYWQGENGQTLYSTVGIMTEQRSGGTLPGRTVSDGTAFSQTQNSDRFDTGLVFNMPLSGVLTFNSRASVMRQQHLHRFGTQTEDDRHQSYLFETSLAGYGTDTDWVIGAAYQADEFNSETFSRFDYAYQVPGLFSQLDYVINPELTASLSARLEHHNEFGTQFNPRVSLLYRPGDVLSLIHI